MPRLPHPTRGGRADKWYIVGAVLLVVVVLAVVVTAMLIPRDEELAENLCPRSGPKAHLVLLVDATDPFTFAQKKSFLLLIDRLTKPEFTSQGTLLSVFVVGENVETNAEPAFERCSPGSGNEKSELTHNLQLWRERFERDFQKPLREVALQLVSLSFQKHGVKGSKRLLLVSDLLQNTPELSLYKETPNWDDLRRRADIQRLRADLAGVDVEAHLLLNSPNIQNRRFIKFWEDYFADMGARMSVKPLPG
jgi:hypothetical protein